MKRHHNLFLAFAGFSLAGGILWFGKEPLVGSVLLAAGLLGFFFLQRASIFVFLANQAFRKGDEPGTLRWFVRASATGRLDADGTTTCVYLHLKAGDVDSAEALVDGALKGGLRERPLKEPARRLLQTYRSLVLWKRGCLDEAVELLEGLLSDGYRTLTLYGNLGFFLVEKGDLVRAGEVCQEALDWDPAGKVLLDNQAALLWAQGNAAGALEVYRRLLDLNPKFPEAWYGAGRAFVAAGDRTEALRCFDRALELPFHALTTVDRSEVERSRAALG